MLTMFLQEKQDKSNGHTSSIRASASQLDPSLTGTQHPDFRRVVIGRNFKDLLIMFTLLNRPVNAGAILLMVLRLRQCCSHLSLMCEVSKRLCIPVVFIMLNRTESLLKLTHISIIKRGRLELAGCSKVTLQISHQIGFFEYPHFLAS